MKNIKNVKIIPAQNNVLLFFLTILLCFTGCNAYTVYEGNGFSAQITNIRTGKYGLKVVDILVKNKSQEDIEIQGVATDNNGIFYAPFDKKAYDNSGKNTTLGLRKVILKPHSEWALVWIPFSSKKETTLDVNSFFISVLVGGVEQTALLH